eukprot:3926161-Rhodomonas_salina.5
MSTSLRFLCACLLSCAYPADETFWGTNEEVPAFCLRLLVCVSCLACILHARTTSAKAGGKN